MQAKVEVTPIQRATAGRRARRRAFARCLGPIASATALLGLVLVLLGASAAAQPVNLLRNGDMEAGAGAALDGWTSFKWEGDGTIEATREAAFQGSRSVMINGLSVAKQAVFQQVVLPPCSYSLTGMVATRGASPNQYRFAAVLHIAFPDGRTLHHALAQGDTDWRRFELQFRVEKSENPIVYLFHYGSGRVFFDDVGLSVMTGCPSVAERLTVSPAPLRTLAYEPPIGEEDRVLAGYCVRPDFAARPVCRRLAKAGVLPVSDSGPRAPIVDRRPLRLADFDTVDPFAPGTPRAPLAIEGRASGLVPAGGYITARPETRLPRDWTGYDWLRIDVHNTSAKAQPVTIELWDERTTDYWSRVNWTTFAPPGRGVVEVPLQSFVGEKVAVRERRRLDLGRIRQLTVASPRVDLIVDNVRLEADPPITRAFPELIALDAEAGSSPQTSGFTSFFAGTVYRPERGWGIIPGSNIGRSEDRRHPDNLNRDWISFIGGGLQFELPNGEYTIWLMMEDAGYWEYYPSWTARSIFIQEREVERQRRGFDDFLKRYFRHASDEDWPGDDIWTRYVRDRYRPTAYKAVVENGMLTIRFGTNGDPLAATLAGLVIYPSARAADGDAFMAEMTERLAMAFNSEQRQHRPETSKTPLPPANAFDGRAWLFERPSAEDTLPLDRPVASDLRARFGLAVARGHTEPLAVAIHVADNEDLAAARLDLPGLDVTPFSVRYRASRIVDDGSVYESRPRVIDPLEVSPARPMRLKAGTTRVLWFDVRATDATKAGAIVGSLELRLADGSAQSVPVTVDVLPFILPAADIPIGYLGVAPIYPMASYPELKLRRIAEMNAAVDLLADAGMTAASGGLGPIRFTQYRHERPVLDTADGDISMAAIRRRFTGDVLTYGGLQLEGVLPPDRPVDTRQLGRPYPIVVRDVIEAIREHGLTAGWLPLRYVVGDEPHGEAIKQSIAVARAMAQAKPNAPTAVFTSFLSPSEETAELAGAVDLLYMNNHSEAAIRHILAKGSSCAIYNRTTRLERGIYLWKLRNVGCRGSMRFALSGISADPWYALDGREDEYSAVLSHPDGRLRPTLDFVRVRQGVTDYRFLHAVELAAKAAPVGDAREAAEAWLRGLSSRIRIGTDQPQTWSDADLDRVRREAIAHLRALDFQGESPAGLRGR